MKEKTTKKSKEEEVPIVSMLIDRYVEQVDDLQITKEKLERVNRRIGILFLITLLLLAIETTYIIACWDYLHPNAGIIQKK